MQVAKRVILWLTDEEFRDYETKAGRIGIGIQQLGTVLICKWLGLESVPTKPKKLKKWVEEHKLRTQAEFQEKGGATEARLEQIMLADPEKLAWTTRELANGLGWKRPAGLNDFLRHDGRFKQVERPESVPKPRGAQPNYWRLSGLTRDGKKES